jgi:hypothetical protein
MVTRENETLRALDRLHADIVEVRDVQREMSDRINAYHGDTVGASDCTKCQTKWVDRRFFSVGLTVAMAIMGIMTWFRGLS